MFTPEERANAEEFLAAIRKRTDPYNPDPHTPVELHPSPTMKTLRGTLTEAKAFLAEVILPLFSKVHAQKADRRIMDANL